MWGPMAITTWRKEREGTRNGGWAENPKGAAQLTYLNLFVPALPELIKSTPTCSDSGGESLEVKGVSIPGLLLSFQTNMKSYFPIVWLLPGVETFLILEH